MFTRGRSNQLVYNHNEIAGGGRLHAQLRIRIPDEIRIGPASSTWLLLVLHNAHQKLLSELSEHHKVERRFFTPPVVALRLAEPQLGDMLIEVRTNTAASRLQINTHVRKAFEPIAAILIAAMKDPDVRTNWLAEQAAIACRNCGVRIDPPDETAYAAIVKEIVNDPPTVEHVLEVEVPVGTSRDVAWLAAHRSI